MPLNRFLTLVPNVGFASWDLAHYPKKIQLHLLGLRHCGSSNRDFLVLRSGLCHLWPYNKIQSQLCPSIQLHLPKVIHNLIKDACFVLIPLSRKSSCDLMVILWALRLTTQFIKLILRCHILTTDGGCYGLCTCQTRMLKT